jgi:APA family basic amino acid/polyamine antiporter
LIFVLIIAGLLIGNQQRLDLSFGPESFGTLLSGPFAVSLVYVMYAYSGWNAATYITDEVRDSATNVPRALLAGTVSVTILYLVLNYVFLLTTPKAVLAGKVEVGLLAGQTIFGPTGGKIVSGLIGVGLIATISAMVWLGPRITKRMGEDLPKLKIFARSSAHGTPYAAIMLQVIVVTILVGTGTFQTVLIYTQFSLLLSSFLTVLGLIVLRFREPNLERPYKVWGYPVTPILFLAITLWMMTFVVLEKPKESLLGLITVLAGLIIFFFSREPRRAIPSQHSK